MFVMLAIAVSASAQEVTSSSASGGWMPIGPAPVDQAGAGRRGYVMPVEDADVTADGSDRISIHTVAANNLFREEAGGFLVSQRYETHSLGIDYRRGFKTSWFPRFEIGGQLQLHERDSGAMNGFISGFENMWASSVHHPSSVNQLRRADAAPLPLGTVILKDGTPLYQDGAGSGLGDVYAVAKIALLEGSVSSHAPRVAARIAINVPGRAAFSAGRYLGMGLNLDQKLSEGAAYHIDIRATRVLDDLSPWNLPLRPWTYAFSVGPELRLPKNSSFNLQFDASSTPYLPTGTLAFDKAYGALTLGVGHRFGPAAAQLYFRENLYLPFQVLPNTDPDLAVGLRIRIR
jgi:hypothetical protein